MTETRVVAMSYDEAVTNALLQLQTTSDNVDIEVLEQGKEGLFGVIGSRPWMLKVSLKTQKADPEEVKKNSKNNDTLTEIKEEISECTEVNNQVEAQKKEKSVYDSTKVIRVNEDNVRKQPAAKKEDVAKTEVKESVKEDNKDTASHKKKKTPQKKNPKPGALKDVKENNDNIGNEEKKPETVKKDHEVKKSLKPVNEEEVKEFTERGEKFLRDIFGVMNMEVELADSFNHEENELDYVLSGEDMGVLIGKRGQTLDSLQYLVSLVVNKHRDGYIRVKLDTENYRERRQEKLEELAHNIAGKVRKTRRSIELEPMNPYERRIIHSALQNDPYVTTISEGEDPYRHVVVIMKKNNKKNCQRRKTAKDVQSSSVIQEEVSEI